MRRLLALCLLFPLAGFATTPPAASTTPESNATLRQQVLVLQTQMTALAKKMAVLSARIGNHADQHALAYLTNGHRGMLGLAVLPDRHGARVEAVTPGGAAERAGIHDGDVITAVDGKPLSAQGQAWNSKLLDLTAGTPLELTLDRHGKTLHITATPEHPGPSDWPALVATIQQAAQGVQAQLDSPQIRNALKSLDSAKARSALKQMQSTLDAHTLGLNGLDTSNVDTGPGHTGWVIGSPWWGLNLAPLNPALGRYFDTDTGALVLSRQRKQFPTLEPGDVITRVAGVRVAQPADAMRALREATAGKSIAVTVLRHGKAINLTLKAPAGWLLLPPPPPVAPVPPLPPPPPVAPPTPPAPPLPAHPTTSR